MFQTATNENRPEVVSVCIIKSSVTVPSFSQAGSAKIRENVSYEMDLVLSTAAQPFYATSSLHKL